MKAAEYAALRAAGRCTWGPRCRRKPTKGSLCAKHRKLHQAASNKCCTRLREERKLAGLCTVCGEPSREDANLCAGCSRKNDERKTKWRNSPAGHKRHQKNVRDHRRRRTEKGQCHRCRRPAVTKTLCQVHRDENNARWLAAHPPKRADKCSRCHKPGHRVTTCREPLPIDRPLPAPPPLCIDDFASRREAA